eukprot:scaffold206095_cov31-Tisochrysis_lutea.AAC.1
MLATCYVTSCGMKLVYSSSHVGHMTAIGWLELAALVTSPSWRQSSPQKSACIGINGISKRA